jgi:hypothetical protein
VPSRARDAGGGAARAGLQPPVEGVVDLPFECPLRLFGGLALGQFLVVVRAAPGVPVADLGDRGHVDGVVHPPVPAQRQPAGDAVAGGHPGRRGAVISGEAVLAGEPGNVTHVADHGGGHRGADPEDLRHRRARGPDRHDQLVLDVAPLDAGAAQVGQELLGQLPAGRPGSAARLHLVQDPGGLPGRDPLADPAGDQLAQHRVQPADHLVTGPAQVPVPLGPHRQHRRVIIGAHRQATRRPQRRDRHRQGVVRVVLVRRPRPRQPDPRGQLGRHAGTRSPAATSCCASRCPSPAAPSTAQVRSG